LDARGKDGFPRRVHLEKAAKGFIPDPVAQAELDEELPLPDVTADVWIHYRQLDNRRRYSSEGVPLRFYWVDIQAYMTVTGIRLGRWYLKTIFALEDEFFRARAENKT